MKSCYILPLLLLILPSAQMINAQTVTVHESDRIIAGNKNLADLSKHVGGNLITITDTELRNMLKNPKLDAVIIQQRKVDNVIQYFILVGMYNSTKIEKLTVSEADYRSLMNLVRRLPI